MHIQKTFDQLSIFANLYQYEKSQAISSIYSRDKIDLKILQSDWLRAFLTISQAQVFPKYGICA